MLPSPLGPSVVSPVDHLTSTLRARQLQIAKLKEAQVLTVDGASTAQTSALTQKWIATAQEVLQELLHKVQQNRPATMEQMMAELQVDPKQVRWNEITSDFE